LSRGAVASLSVLLGLISWLITLGLGRGPTPLQAGWRYLVILAIAGFVVAFLERDTSWTALLGLYLGQAAALSIQFLVGIDDAPEPLPLQFLFILSFTLAAALGGLVGAAWGVARLSRGALSAFLGSPPDFSHPEPHGSARAPVG